MLFQQWKNGLDVCLGALFTPLLHHKDLTLHSYWQIVEVWQAHNLMCLGSVCSILSSACSAPFTTSRVVISFSIVHVRFFFLLRSRV